MSGTIGGGRIVGRIDTRQNAAHTAETDSGLRPTARESDMTMTAAISARIMLKVQEGMTVQEAMAAVLGADKVEALISDLYDALRAKAVA